MTVDQHLVGREGIARTTVNAGNTADAYGNAGLQVFATPALVALVEQAAMEAIRDDLVDGGCPSAVWSGSATWRRRRAAGPSTPGQRCVRSRAGGSGSVSVAHDATEQVGEGEHQRIVIDTARFLARVERKIPAEG